MQTRVGRRAWLRDPLALGLQTWIRSDHARGLCFCDYAGQTLLTQQTCFWVKLW